MKSSTVTAQFPYDCKTVWDIVTDNKNYAWRSDLSRIEVIDENYSDWVEVPWEQSGIEAAIDHCIKCNMAKFAGDFKLGGYEIKDALFQVESLPDNLSCFYIEMPELFVIVRQRRQMKVVM